MDTDAKKEVFALFQTGADHGDAISMANLGVLYQSGSGGPQDYAKAREWYEKAADKGEARAMTRLGVLYQTVRAGRRTTPRRASGTKRPLTRATRTPWKT